MGIKADLGIKIGTIRRLTDPGLNCNASCLSVSSLSMETSSSIQNSF